MKVNVQGEFGRKSPHEILWDSLPSFQKLERTFSRETLSDWLIGSLIETDFDMNSGKEHCLELSGYASKAEG